MNPDFLQELKRHFSGDVRLDAASRILYATDASIYQISPLGVAIPKSQEDLISVVELAAKYSIPILPRGAGTSLGGQAIGEALILDCSRYLDSIVEIDPGTHSAIVEPGVVLSDLNQAAAKYGLMFGPDPASAERATMGGVIGNNATGAHSILYGMSADHLISADVILGDSSLETWDVQGTSKLSGVTANIRAKYAEAIKSNFPVTWRNSAGYRINYLLPWSPSVPPQWDEQDYGLATTVYKDSTTVNMASLLAGSEGTLAIMRCAKVNLVPKPKNTILGVLTYGSVAEACEDVPRLLKFKPSAIELIPQMIIRFARSVPGFAQQMDWMMGDPAAVLVIEFSGDQPRALKEAVRGLGRLVTIAESTQEQAQIWRFRKVGLGILDSRQRSARPAAFIEDCAVPVEQLGLFVREVERIMSEHNTEGGIYAHASAGCLHIRPILNLQQEDGVRALRSIAGQVSALVLSLGGSMSSEHGDGLARGEWIEKTYGKDVAEAMRSLKRAADPHNILNPRKMLDAPPMDSNLRYGSSYQVKVLHSALHFGHERGLAGAIEQCNGQGVCRKTSGTMCPSFQATREEALNTRGRANLLRAWMSSTAELDLARAAEVESATYAALDLCLACKGCTSECPSGVDMPRLKYEFMNTYYESHRRPLHDYLFGYFHVVSKWLVPIAPLANAFMRMNWSRQLIAKSAGITDRRPFPVFAKQEAVPPISTTGSKRKTVLFLQDVFSKYLEPQVAQASFDLLELAGYDVIVLPIVGAGASLLSKGFVAAAREHAAKVLDAIKANEGESRLSVVGCEPPEVYCLKHEYTSLLPQRRAEIEAIVERVWMVEEFLLREDRLTGTSGVSQPGIKITFHPHCHQRAEGPAGDGLPTGSAATIELLRGLGFDVDLIDAGCCGMAGTFGYDADHYELSMQIGEIGVLPGARQADALGRRIVSSGSACRIQIREGAGLEVKHPLELIRDYLFEHRAAL